MTARIGADIDNGFNSFVVWDRGRRSTRDLVLGAQRSCLASTFGFDLLAIPLGDINGDDRADFATSAVTSQRPVSVVLGRHWRERRHLGTARGRGIYPLTERVSAEIEAIGDINGDGVGYLLVHPDYSRRRDTVLLRAGRSGPITSLARPGPGSFEIR